MKRALVVSISLFVIVFSLSSCSHRRTAGAFWEDTKTAGRHMGRGLRSLSGKQGDSKQIHHPSEFKGPEEQDFIALQDDEPEQGLHANEKSYPLSRLSPGEQGSFLPGIEGFFEPDSKQAKIFKPIYFDTNKHHIVGASNQETARAIAQYMKKNPNVYLFIEGHCDERGTALYNMSLGARRSNMVRNLLIQEGVDMDRVFTISYGKEKPAVLGHDPDSWTKNRRAQFKLFASK